MVSSTSGSIRPSASRSRKGFLMASSEEMILEEDEDEDDLVARP